MNWLLIGLLTAITAAAQTPAETAQSLNTQGNRVAESGNYPEAKRLYQESIRIWRSLGPEFEGHTAGTLLNLAVALAGDGQRQEASKVLEEALVLHRRALGTTHHHTLSNMNLLASNYLMLGDPDRAEALLKEALPIERELYPDDIQTARTLEGLSNLMIRRGQGQRGAAAGRRGARNRHPVSPARTAWTRRSPTPAWRKRTASPGPRSARCPCTVRPAALVREGARTGSSPGGRPAEPGGTDPDAGRQALAGRASRWCGPWTVLRKTCPDCVVELSIRRAISGCCV